MFTYVTILMLFFCIYFQYKSIQLNKLVASIKKRYTESGEPLTTRKARQKAVGRDVERFRMLILYKHTLTSWITRRLSFGLLYVFYVFFPLSGIFLVLLLDLHSENLLTSSFMWFGDISPMSGYTDTPVSQLCVWAVVSLMSTYGLIVCAKLSIRTFREQWCTKKDRDCSD